MTKVDFYVVENNTRENVACRVIEKAYQKNHKVYVHTDSLMDAEHFDEHLWTFQDNSFIPHNLIEEKITPQPPVRIGHGDVPADQSGTLINLSGKPLPDFSRFSRIVEIVDRHNKEPMREQYKFYKSQDCELTSYKV